MNENEKYVLSNKEIFSKLALIEIHLSGFEGRIYTPSNNFNPQDIISHCGYKKENVIKDKKELFIKCPKCGYLFLWDATPLRKKVDEEDFSPTESLEKKTIWDRMSKWIHSSSKESLNDD